MEVRSETQNLCHGLTLRAFKSSLYSFFCSLDYMFFPLKIRIQRRSTRLQDDRQKATSAHGNGQINEEIAV